MRIPTILLMIQAISFGQLVKIPERQPVPEEVMRAAQVATQRLCDQVVKGDFKAAVDKMYRPWKKKEARKLGSIAKLDAKLIKALNDTRAKGVRVNKMNALKPTSAFEVSFGLEKRKVNGKETNVGVYRDWLVFVPTEQLMQTIDASATPPKTYKMLIQSYQVAICRKGTNNWTFLSGNEGKAFLLRKFFPYLPKTDDQLNLPKEGGKVLDVN